MTVSVDVVIFRPPAAGRRANAAQGRLMNLFIAVRWAMREHLRS